MVEELVTRQLRATPGPDSCHGHGVGHGLSKDFVKDSEGHVLPRRPDRPCRCVVLRALNVATCTCKEQLASRVSFWRQFTPPPLGCDYVAMPVTGYNALPRLSQLSIKLPVICRILGSRVGFNLCSGAENAVDCVDLNLLAFRKRK